MKELSIKEKELLVKDLSSRLPYEVMCQFYHEEFNANDEEPFAIYYNEKLSSASNSFIGSFSHNIDKIRPYLRPMSSMTEEEKEELNCLCYHNIDVQDERICGYICADEMYDVIDWLNKKMFDYRGLISMGLAIDCTGLHIYD